jgi:hypothetical protein
VYYTHKEIYKAKRFLEDFGFVQVQEVGKKIYYAGTGPDQFIYWAEEGEENRFGGAALVVESREDPRDCLTHAGPSHRNL